MIKGKILILTICLFLAGCLLSTRSKHLSELDGFRGIHWGSEVNKLEGMLKVEPDKPSSRDITWYTRRGETLTFGDAKLENVFYSFWMGSFESVWIDFRGEENFKKLKAELFERFGKVLESRELMKKKEKEPLLEGSTMRYGEEEFYFWDGKETEMWLSYSKNRQRGALSINSKKINEERRSYEKAREKEERFRERKF
jgi:hypothetical protein